MRNQRSTLMAALAVLLLAFAAAGTAAGAEYDYDEVQLATDLSGDEVVGDDASDGEAEAEIDINLETDVVCFDIEWEDTDAPSAAHIHEGEAGGTGDVVVDLTQAFDPAQIADDEEVEGCLQTGEDDHDTLQDIADNPESYYVELHNDDGALRGQLAYD